MTRGSLGSRTKHLLTCTKVSLPRCATNDSPFAEGEHGTLPSVRAARTTATGAAISLAALLLGACTTCGYAAPGSAAPIGITMHQDFGGGQRGPDLAYFPTTQRTLIFHANAGWMRQGQQVRWVLTGLGRTLSDAVQVIPMDGVPGLDFRPTNDVDWPSGGYRVDLYVDNVPVAARDVLIAIQGS